MQEQHERSPALHAAPHTGRVVRTLKARRALRTSTSRDTQKPYRSRRPRRDVISLLIMAGGVALGADAVITASIGIAHKLGLGLSLAGSQPIGRIIGSTHLARNQAIPFRNPHTRKHEVLIHLPNDTFVAYEQTCTHSEVLVDYDPATHLLVCPAHGAIFDPIHGGKVVQGPAVTPLPQVAVRIQADGTITLA